MFYFMEIITYIKSTITLFDRTLTWLQKDLFFNILISLVYAFSTMMNKNIYAALIKIYVDNGKPQFNSC